MLAAPTRCYFQSSWMRCIRWIAFASFAILAGIGARLAPAAEPEIHYAPVENLEHIDLALIRSATKSVDVAAYSLTDWAIISALTDARTRGVIVRIAQI